MKSGRIFFWYFSPLFDAASGDIREKAIEERMHYSDVIVNNF